MTKKLTTKKIKDSYLDHISNCCNIKTNKKERGNIILQKKNMPPNLKKHVEKSFRKKFKINPKLYVYEDKRKIKPFKKIKKMPAGVGCWQGSSMDIYDPKDKKLLDMVIIIPKSSTKNKKIRDVAILHELSEMLAAQSGIKKTKSHKLAKKIEMKYLKKIKMTPKEIASKERKLFNNPESWE